MKSILMVPDERLLAFYTWMAHGIQRSFGPSSYRLTVWLSHLYTVWMLLGAANYWVPALNLVDNPTVFDLFIALLWAALLQAEAQKYHRYDQDLWEKGIVANVNRLPQWRAFVSVASLALTAAAVMSHNRSWMACVGPELLLLSWVYLQDVVPLRPDQLRSLVPVHSS